jgi:predicted PurR-regulated permease PerM
MNDTRLDERPEQEIAGHQSRAADAALVVLAILASVVAIWLAREVLVPLALALVAATLLRPAVGQLERRRVPSPAAAAIVVLSTLALLGGIGVALETPVRSMVADLPESVNTARAKLESVTARLRAITGGAARPSPNQKAPSPTADAQHGAPAPLGGIAGQAPGSPAPGAGGAQSAMRSAFGATTALLTEIVEEVLLVFFLLAAGKRWMEKLGRITAAPNRERLWPSIAAEMHDVVARYLLVTLFINIGQAIVIGLALWALDVPTPLVWGALTFIAEFVPYLGGFVMIALLTATGLTTNQSVAHALLAPGAYLVVTTLQNNLVSPVAYGRGLRLNPTMILLGVMFWWMVWGVAGAFLAVPILASLRVLGSRIPTLRPMAVMLEE